MAVAVLEDCAEAVAVNLKDVVEFDNPGMFQRLVDVVLPESVLDVVGLLVVRPVLVELEDLTGNIPIKD